MYRRPLAAIDRDNIRAHGQDENIAAESFDRGNGFFHDYIKVLTSH